MAIIGSHLEAYSMVIPRGIYCAQLISLLALVCIVAFRNWRTLQPWHKWCAVAGGVVLSLSIFLWLACAQKVYGYSVIMQRITPLVSVIGIVLIVPLLLRAIGQRAIQTQPNSRKLMRLLIGHVSIIFLIAVAIIGFAFLAPLRYREPIRYLMNSTYIHASIASAIISAGAAYIAVLLSRQRLTQIGYRVVSSRAVMFFYLAGVSIVAVLYVPVWVRLSAVLKQLGGRSESIIPVTAFVSVDFAFHVLIVVMFCLMFVANTRPRTDRA